MKSTLSKKETILALGHCNTYFPGPNPISIAKIFAENRWRLLVDYELYRKGIRPAIMKAVNSIILCEYHDLGHTLYECPHCENFTFVQHTCKSRFCNQWGIKYARLLSDSILSKVFDCPHRHGVFTVPEPLRPYFQKDRSLLDELFKAVEDTLHYVIRKAGRKNEELIPCAVLTLHTFGKPLNWIPHIHVLLAEGGVRKSGSFKPLNHIHYDSLRFSFQKQLLDRMENKLNSPDFKIVKKQCYRDYPDGFYVYSPPSTHKSTQDCVDYIVRYVGRPVMAQSRIEDYDVDLDFVWWHYIDHQTHERVDVFDSTLVFMKKLILHIPDDHFKMVRFLGAYTSRKKKLCRCIQKMLRKPRAWIRKKLSSYREFRKESTGIDPFLCSCGHIMEFVESFFPAGLEVKINETWELYDWHRELDPLQVY